MNFIEWIILLVSLCQNVISTQINHLTYIDLKNNQILKVQIIKCLYLCKWLKPLKLENLTNQDQMIRLIKSHNFKINTILHLKSNRILVHSEEQEEEEEVEEYSEVIMLLTYKILMEIKCLISQVVVIKICLDLVAMIKVKRSLHHYRRVWISSLKEAVYLFCRIYHRLVSLSGTN